MLTDDVDRFLTDTATSLVAGNPSSYVSTDSGIYSRKNACKDSWIYGHVHLETQMIIVIKFAYIYIHTIMIVYLDYLN